MAATSWWSYTLLQRTPDWNPWLGPVVLLGGLGVAVALLPRSWLEGRTGALVGAAAIVLGLLGATAYTLETARTPHEGAIPSAGPAVLTRFGLGRGGPFGGGTAGRPPGRTGQFPVGPRALPATGTAPAGGAAPGGAAGGLLDASEPSSELVALLEADADQYTWVAATVGSNSAAGYQLATDQAVMSIGGFNGTDPSPSLAEFQADVDAGKIHYFIAGGFGGRGGRGGPGGNARSTSSEITTWVESNFTATTVGDITVYDLTS
jgi:hypothetical protein